MHNGEYSCLLALSFSLSLSLIIYIIKHADVNEKKKKQGSLAENTSKAKFRR